MEINVFSKIKNRSTRTAIVLQGKHLKMKTRPIQPNEKKMENESSSTGPQLRPSRMQLTD